MIIIKRLFIEDFRSLDSILPVGWCDDVIYWNDGSVDVDLAAGVTIEYTSGYPMLTLTYKRKKVRIPRHRYFEVILA